jgi:hypothetical protein
MSVLPTLAEVKAFETEADSILASVSALISQAASHSSIFNLLGLGSVVADVTIIETAVKGAQGLLKAVETVTAAL